MGKELDYLYKKLIELDHKICLCEYGLEMNFICECDLDKLREEKEILINIKNSIKQVV